MTHHHRPSRPTEFLRGKHKVNRPAPFPRKGKKLIPHHPADPPFRHQRPGRILQPQLPSGRPAKLAVPFPAIANLVHSPTAIGSSSQPEDLPAILGKSGRKGAARHRLPDLRPAIGTKGQQASLSGGSFQLGHRDKFPLMIKHRTARPVPLQHSRLPPHPQIRPRVSNAWIQIRTPRLAAPAQTQSAHPAGHQQSLPHSHRHHHRRIPVPSDTDGRHPVSRGSRRDRSDHHGPGTTPRTISKGHTGTHK